MRTPSTAMRRIATATATSFALTAVSPAMACGWTTLPGGSNRTDLALTPEVKKITPELHASGVVAGFIIAAEKAGRNPSDAPQVVDYPTKTKDRTVYMTDLRIAGVMYGKGFGSFDTKVCVEQNGQVLGLYKIPASGGLTKITDWTGGTKAVGNSPACKDFIVAARNEAKEIQAKYGQMAVNGVCVSPEAVAGADTGPTASPTMRPPAVVATGRPTTSATFAAR